VNDPQFVIENFTLPQAIEILSHLPDLRDGFFDLRKHNPILATPIDRRTT
jgi:hypothetical protein